MPVGTGVILGSIAAAGLATSAYGNIKANQAQAEAERANASFLEEQARFAQAATQRELSIYRDQSEEFRGAQVSAFARGGVDLTGSPMLVLANAKARQVGEERAIIDDGKAKAREAFLKAGASMEQAERLSSFEANVLPVIGQGLSTASGFLARSK